MINPRTLHPVAATAKLEAGKISATDKRGFAICGSLIKRLEGRGIHVDLHKGWFRMTRGEASLLFRIREKQRQLRTPLSKAELAFNRRIGCPQTAGFSLSPTGLLKFEISASILIVESIDDRFGGRIEELVERLISRLASEDSRIAEAEEQKLRAARYKARSRQVYEKRLEDEKKQREASPCRSSTIEPPVDSKMPAIVTYTIDEAASQLSVSRRWLQSFIQHHPHYACAGRKKIFSAKHIVALFEAMSLPTKSHQLGPRRRTTAR